MYDSIIREVIAICGGYQLDFNNQDLFEHIAKRLAYADAHFNPTKGNRESFLKFCGKRAYWEYLRLRIKRNKDTIQLDERHEPSYQDKIVELKYTFGDIIRSLPSRRNREIVELYYLKRQTLEDLGLMYLLSRQRVQQILAESCIKMREFCDRNDMEITDFI